jgi:MFS family permease
MRWIVLLLVSVVLALSFYAYDSLSPIKETIQVHLNFSSTDYGLLVSVYSIPNTLLFMVILGGVLADRWGIRKTGLLAALACVLGAVITAYGASDIFGRGGFGHAFLGSFLPRFSAPLKMMILGRFLFGLGAETLNIVVLKILVKWFKGRKMAFAFSLMTIIARMGTAAVLILSPVLIEAGTGWTTSLWGSAFLMFLGLLLLLVYLALDRRMPDAPPAAADDFQSREITGLLKNRSFVFICLLCVMFYSAFFPFLSFLPDLLRNKFQLSLRLSGALSSLMIWGTIVFIPLVGWFVDNKGKIASLLLYGSGMLFLSHLILATTRLSPYLAIVVLGLAFTLVPAALWPAVPRIVDERRVGTAYGIMTWTQSLGILTFPYLAGRITDLSNPGVTSEMIRAGRAGLDYTNTSLMFAGLGIMSFVFALMLKKEDSRKSGFGLELPEKRIKPDVPVDRPGEVSDERSDHAG